MREVFLTQGKVALVDDSDYLAVNTFTWYAHKRGRCFYAARKSLGKTLSLHNILMPGVGRVDHKNGNGLDNQRHNLRPATARQNQQASLRKRLNVSSNYRGVSWNTEHTKWTAQIQVNGVVKFLGRFQQEKDAALAYDAAARMFFGEFAAPNFEL